MTSGWLLLKAVTALPTRFLSDSSEDGWKMAVMKRQSVSGKAREWSKFAARTQATMRVLQGIIVQWLQRAGVSKSIYG
jgi:hypothetical protein